MARSQLPIPDDWNGQDWLLAVLCVPDSRLWRAIVRGKIYELSRGRTWDANTGTITAVQAIGREILESLDMTCGADIARIADAVEAGNTTLGLIKSSLDGLDLPDVVTAINGIDTPVTDLAGVIAAINGLDLPDVVDQLGLMFAALGSISSSQGIIATEVTSMDATATAALAQITAQTGHLATQAGEATNQTTQLTALAGEAASQTAHLATLAGEAETQSGYQANLAELETVADNLLQIATNIRECCKRQAAGSPPIADITSYGPPDAYKCRGAAWAVNLPIVAMSDIIEWIENSELVFGVLPLLGPIITAYLPTIFRAYLTVADYFTEADLHTYAEWIDKIGLAGMSSVKTALEAVRSDLLCDIYSAATAEAALSNVLSTIDGLVALDADQRNFALFVYHTPGPINRIFGRTVPDTYPEDVKGVDLIAAWYDGDCSECGGTPLMIETADTSPYNVMIVGTEQFTTDNSDGFITPIGEANTLTVVNPPPSHTGHVRVQFEYVLAGSGTGPGPAVHILAPSVPELSEFIGNLDEMSSPVDYTMTHDFPYIPSDLVLRFTGDADNPTYAVRKVVVSGVV